MLLSISKLQFISQILPIKEIVNTNNPHRKQKNLWLFKKNLQFFHHHSSSQRQKQKVLNSMCPNNTVLISVSLKPASNKVSAKATVTFPFKLSLAQRIAWAVPRGSFDNKSYLYANLLAISIKPSSTSFPKSPMIKPISSTFSLQTSTISSHKH